jgi:hypothetical protein
MSTASLQLPCALTKDIRLVDWDNDRGGVLFATAGIFFAPGTSAKNIKADLVRLVAFLTDVTNTTPPPKCYRELHSGDLDGSRSLLGAPRILKVTKVHWACSCVFISGETPQK